MYEQIYSKRKSKIRNKRTNKRNKKKHKNKNKHKKKQTTKNKEKNKSEKTKETKKQERSIKGSTNIKSFAISSGVCLKFSFASLKVNHLLDFGAHSVQFYHTILRSPTNKVVSIQATKDNQDHVPKCIYVYMNHIIRKKQT